LQRVLFDIIYTCSEFACCRSQWPRGLRHEQSSLAWTLGSWVWIPLKEWMSALCAFILCLCCSVCSYRPCNGLIPRPRSPAACVKDQDTEKRPRPNKGL
jgi:hypothetical protein